MSPIQPFDGMRPVIAEVSVWRQGMAEPKAGDIIERDGGQVRVLKVARRTPTPDDVRFLDARPDLGNYMLLLEYELLP